MFKGIDRNLIPIPEPDYEDPKEPYAFYGLAAYYAQCLEQSIIILLIALRASGEKGTKGATYDEALASLDKEAMGTLIKLLKKVVKVDPALEECMNELLQKRNYLAHHFFERNSLKLLSELGRRAVLDDLRQIAQAFRDGDRILVGFYEPLFAKFGIGREEIERELDKMRAESV